MTKNKLKIVLLIALLFSISTHAESLFEAAKNRGINETCALYLSQIENTYNLQGLNMTFAHPENPSLFPSLHITSQKYNNGTTTFSATLNPNKDFCYLSTIHITSVNNQSCQEVSKLKVEANPNLQVNNYADGNYTIITPLDRSYQIILTILGEKGCTINETRMIWPGK